MYMMRLEVAYQANAVEKVTGQSGGDLECGGEVKKDPVDAHVCHKMMPQPRARGGSRSGARRQISEPQQLFEE